MLALCSFTYARPAKCVFRPTRIIIPTKVVLSPELDWDSFPRAFPYHHFTVHGHAR